VFTLLFPIASGQGRKERGKGAQFPWHQSLGGAENSQQCHKYFLQYNTFTSERAQVRKWGRQTCFLTRAPSKLGSSLLPKWMHQTKRYRIFSIQDLKWTDFFLSESRNAIQPGQRSRHWRKYSKVYVLNTSSFFQSQTWKNAPLPNTWKQPLNSRMIPVCWSIKNYMFKYVKTGWGNIQFLKHCYSVALSLRSGFLPCALQSKGVSICKLLSGKPGLKAKPAIQFFVSLLFTVWFEAKLKFERDWGQNMPKHQ